MIADDRPCFPLISTKNLKSEFKHEKLLKHGETVVPIYLLSFAKGRLKHGETVEWTYKDLLRGLEKDGHEQPSGMEADDDGTLNRVANAETQATSISSEKQVGTIVANNLQHQQLHDELEDQLSDFGDDVTPVTSQNGAILRRKLRMVIDPKDDE
ncbi:unnamed protein product [Camellia sinensis]